MRNAASILHFKLLGPPMNRILFNRGKAAVTLAVLFAAISTASIQAQGTVLFQNNERGLVYQWSSLFDPTPTLFGADNLPHIQIAYAPAGTPLTAWTLFPGWDNSTEHWLSLNPGWTLGPTANSVGLGTFDGGTLSLDGIPAGTKADYVTFGWGP